MTGKKKYFLANLFVFASLMGWALFPASSKASVQDDFASARAAVQSLESQLASAQSQLNIDTQTVI